LPGMRGTADGAVVRAIVVEELARRESSAG
jgi:hypothetical protein